MQWSIGRGTRIAQTWEVLGWVQPLGCRVDTRQQTPPTPTHALTLLEALAASKLEWKRQKREEKLQNADTVLPGDHNYIRRLEVKCKIQRWRNQTWNYISYHWIAGLQMFARKIILFFLYFKKPSLADCTSHTGTLVERVGGRGWWWSRLVGVARVFEVCLLVEAKICKGTPHLL